MKLNVLQIQQLIFEIEGKAYVNQATGEKTVELQGALKADNLSQGEKLELRKFAKTQNEFLKVVEEQKKALLEESFNDLGTSKAKLKEGKSEDEVNKQYNDLLKTEHEVEKIAGIDVDLIKNIKGTSDFYDLLIQLQSS